MTPASGPSDVCNACGKLLEADEIAVYKKLINRGATSFRCIPCLASDLRIPPELIRQKIVQFRRQGCLLFVSEEELAERMAKATKST